MKFRFKQSVWVAAQHSAAFIHNPLDNLNYLIYVKEGVDWPQSMGYVRIGECFIELSADEEEARAAAVKGIDEKVAEVRAEFTRKVEELTAAKQSLLAITSEG